MSDHITSKLLSKVHIRNRFVAYWEFLGILRPVLPSNHISALCFLAPDG